MASSSGSSVIHPEVKYDVFLSFRGTDTRQTFTSHLHAALIRKKVDTYMDYRLERGDEIGPALRKAIQQSKISVIILSKDYASSTWCLDELEYILECKEKHGQYVIPIFYGIDPSHVRHQIGSYKTAFAKHNHRFNRPIWKEALVVRVANLLAMPFANHEQRLEDKTDKTDKVAKWKEALVKAADLSGSHSASRAARDDADLVEQVVKNVLVKLNRESSSFDFTGLIGVESRIKKILLELDNFPEDVRVRSVVLWGMGGIGKTTLADAVFHGLSSQFEGHCFLINVRERSGTKGSNISTELYDLRNELLRQLLREESLKIRTPTIDAATRERLSRTKALVVLDDVNHSSQLTFLAGEVPFGPGSRIIITTRDKGLVTDTGLVNEEADRDVKIHEVDNLDDVESLRLFRLKAPTNCIDDPEFLEKVANHAAGVPLALTTLGSLFRRCKCKEEHDQLWDKLKKFPNNELQNVYRASYDGLEEPERDIFLDIACFHKRKRLCDAKRILAACGLFPDHGIKILIDMSLISIKDDCIWMHDVIQEMGYEIVRKEDTDEPGKRSRLQNREDIRHVLTRNTGTAKVKNISYDFGSMTITLDAQAFTGMHNLRYLMLYHIDNMKSLEYLPATLGYLYWFRYPLESMPSKFSPDNLVELHMPQSKLKRLWNNGQRPQNLKRIDLRHSVELVEVPDLSKCLDLEYLHFEGCRSLVQVPSYFHGLCKLTYLNLNECSNIRTLPEMPSEMKCLGLKGTATEEWPSSIWSLKRLAKLDLSSRDCMKDFPRSPRIISIEPQGSNQPVGRPASIYELKSLKKLDLSGRFRIKRFPEILKVIDCLKFLRLHDKEIEELPSSIGNLVRLDTLEISSCGNLESIPSSMYNLKFLKHLSVTGCLKLRRLPHTSVVLCPLINLDLSDCRLLEEIPDGLISLTSLRRLNLSGTMIQTINPTIKQASGLKYLNVSNCKHLLCLPELPCLSTLLANGCPTLRRVAYPMTAATEELDQRHSFCGAIDLDKNTRSNMMDDARLRILRMATDHRYSSSITLICPGIENPKWFSCEEVGSSIKIKLPQHWFEENNFLGFAFSAVLPFYIANSVEFECECNLSTNEELNHQLSLLHSHSLKARLDVLEEEHSDHLLLVYRFLSLPDTAKWATEVSFHFTAILDSQLIEVKRCGVCFLYAQGQDHDFLKFEVIGT